jgi:peptidoglycan-associated lipoprotein
MKFRLLMLTMGISAVALLSGCHKKPVAAAPPPPPPAVRDNPAPAQERARETARESTPASRPPAQVTSENKSTKAFEDYLNKLLDAYFDYNKADLRSDAQTALNSDSGQLRGYLKEFPNAKFVVEGSCDERGSAEYNLALGERRAAAAKEFLTQIGVPSERLSTISYGKEKQVCTDHTEDCWQKNRRAHLTASN